MLKFIIFSCIGLASFLHSFEDRNSKKKTNKVKEKQRANDNKDSNRAEVDKQTLL